MKTLFRIGNFLIDILIVLAIVRYGFVINENPLVCYIFGVTLAIVLTSKICLLYIGGAKDKKNKELQDEIDKLDKEISELSIYPTKHFHTERKEIETLVSEINIPYEHMEMIDDEYIRSILSENLRKEIKSRISIQERDDFLRNMKIYRAILKVVMVFGTIG